MSIKLADQYDIVLFALVLQKIKNDLFRYFSSKINIQGWYWLVIFAGLVNVLSVRQWLVHLVQKLHFDVIS